MKTVNSQYFLNVDRKFKTPLQWRRLGSLLRAAIRGSELWLLDQHWHGMYLQAQRILAHVVRAARAFRIALRALALSATASKRIYAGLGFVGIVTPLASCFYLLFNQSVRIEGWYHLNNFYLFMLLGPYLSGLALTIGVFLLFPPNVKRAYTLIIPAAYFIGKIIWLYQTETNAEYWTVPSWPFFAVGACIAVVIFLLSDWICKRKFHGEDRFEARLDGIISHLTDEDVSAEKFRSLVRTTWRERKEFKRSF